MKLKVRICGVLSCALAYVGAVAIDLYNAARYNEESYLDGGHLYTNRFSVYDIPQMHSIDGYDVFAACFWSMLLILPLLLFFAVRRVVLNGWYKTLIVMSVVLLMDRILYNMWLLSQTHVPQFDWGGGTPLYMLYTMVMFGIKAVYVVMLVIWPFIRLKKNIRYSNEI